FDLHQAGGAIAAIVDARAAVSDALTGRCAAAGIPLLAAHRLETSHGRRRVSGCTVRPIGGGQPRRLVCDLILTAGGWTPAAQLFTHAGGR
ncbi:hypothetical protein, partial [Klebsiella pneumoniae]|uniref:hypothetical protein n=1 Tax=Klebsiella pneumoniae TaxID=573 RepID=UPI003857F261